MNKFKLVLCLTAVCVCLTTVIGAPQTSTAGEINTGYFGNVAIEGYDPVAYFTMKKAVRGKEDHAINWLGVEWRFASKKHRELFATNPISYAPQYGGHCADGVGYGDKTANIDPEAWVIIDNRLYLNSAKPMKKEFVESAEIRKKAEENWPKVKAYLQSQ